MTLFPREFHPHGMSETRLVEFFTAGKPIVFTLHGYQRAIHEIVHGHVDRFHIRGRGLRTHLEQLRVLYEQISPFKTKSFLETIVPRTMWMPTPTKQVPCPSYPEEDYEMFVIRAIARKKRRVEMELDIEDIPALIRSEGVSAQSLAHRIRDLTAHAG